MPGAGPAVRGVAGVAFACLLFTPACHRPAPAARSFAPAATVYRDPKTGRFGAPPPGVAPALAPAARLSTSTAGLTEVASPRGGVMVRLDGRFQNQMRATRTKTGLTTECSEPREPR